MSSKIAYYIMLFLPLFLTTVPQISTIAHGLVPNAFHGLLKAYIVFALGVAFWWRNQSAHTIRESSWQLPLWFVLLMALAFFLSDYGHLPYIFKSFGLKFFIWMVFGYAYVFVSNITISALQKIHLVKE